jgi:putative transposase
MQAHVVERRDAAVKRILELEATGRLPAGALRVAAVSLGVSERSLRRWKADGGYAPQKRQAWKLTAEAIEAFYRSGGRPASAWRTLSEAGADIPSQRAFYRALERELAPAERAYARDGEEGWRRNSVYLKWEPQARNDVWEADHAQLDVEVVALRGSRLQRPWLTVIEDAYSRLIMGWALSLYPTSAEVLTALREAIVIDDDRGPWGGVPHVVRFDGGKDFLSKAVARAAAEVGFVISMTAPYSPYQKGKVERLHQTINTELIATLPHFLGGPRRADGKLYAQPRPLTLVELQEKIRLYVAHYNSARAHSSLGGLTPQEKWDSSLTILDRVDPRALRWMMMADKERTVQSNGIFFENEYYIDTEGKLQSIGRGTVVQIRYMPHDKRSIEVFTDDGYLCTARPQGQLEREDKDAVIEARHEAKRAAARRKTRASRAAKARTEPLTGKTPVVDITVVTERSANPTARPRKGLSERSSNELLDALGLADELNTADPTNVRRAGEMS